MEGNSNSEGGKVGVLANSTEAGTTFTLVIETDPVVELVTFCMKEITIPILTREKG